MIPLIECDSIWSRRWCCEHHGLDVISKGPRIISFCMVDRTNHGIQPNFRRSHDPQQGSLPTALRVQRCPVLEKRCRTRHHYRTFGERRCLLQNPRSERSPYSGNFPGAAHCYGW
ncbi:hypothetical protein TNIN_388981 [Trichonephila inaurata madagascariensis]|uniref:Uncharacterized protein n=1 Tax=Trichonephila inaurata madagascariensis TaxID=2747483 RepID=A0A8X6I5J9_9ARAC|nr:hypothetical protein TNIN_388981 [Trichonephila inaurata madagascariensis]